jgi:hypothetical protein
MTLNRLHLIERMGLEKPWPNEPGYTASGFWAFTEEQAKSFVGCFLFLHEGQSEPVRYAGEIVGVIEETEGKYAGRYIFKVKDDPRLNGLMPSHNGWQRWWKAE